MSTINGMRIAIASQKKSKKKGNETEEDSDIIENPIVINQLIWEALKSLNTVSQ